MDRSAPFLAAVFLLGGCTTTISVQKGPLPSLDTYRDGPLVLDVQIQEWDQRFIPNVSTTTYDIVDGTGKGEIIEMVTTSTGEGAWSLALKDRSTFEWTGDSAGLACTSTIDVPSGTTSTFTPPLPVIPRDLKPGVPFTATGEIVVKNTAPPSSRVASGTWTVSITHDADAVLKFGDTTFRCARLCTVYTADLGLASVDRTAYDFYAPDQGWVAQVFQQKVRKLIIDEHTSGTWVVQP